MKTKSKKFHNLTEKQKRKDRSVNRDLPPSGFRRIFNRSFEAKLRQALIKNLQGKETEFPIFVKNVGWNYW